MKKEFKGLGENWHKKIYQARVLWYNQNSITQSFSNVSEDDYRQATYF